MGKFEELGHKARELFVQGMSQKDIAKALDVSEATLVEWKKKYEDTSFDWENGKRQAMQKKKTVAAWLDEQIQITMSKVEEDKNHCNDELLNRLAKFISMRKNYDGSIDKLGETKRVMSEFAMFVKREFPDDVELEMCKSVV